MRKNEIYKEKLLLANIDGIAYTFIGAHRFEAFHKATFNPSTVYTFLDLGEIHGRTYAERKEDARRKAVEFSTFDRCGLSWFECSLYQSYFEKLARCFGLVQEFKENGVI